MTDKFMGSSVKSYRYTGIEPDLTHEDKKRENGEPVACYNFIDIPCEEIESAIKTVKIAETDKADQCHGKTELYTGSKEQKEHYKAYNTYHHLIHVCPSR